MTKSARRPDTSWPNRLTLVLRLFALALLSCASVLTVARPVLAASEETDLAQAASSPEREIALRSLEQAHAVAEKAQAALAVAKAQLDDFVVQHFEEHRLHGTEPLPRLTPIVPENPVDRSDAGRLSSQLDELTALRDDLLSRLTPAHPEVVDIERRIRDLSQRVVARGPIPYQADTPGGPPTNGTDGEKSLVERLSRDMHHDREAADHYAQLVDRVQTAERERQSAVEAEYAAAQRVAAVKIAASPRPPIKPTVEVVTVEAQNSQPLALAALLIALAVAALAAVKLARSSTDTVFASVDDVASTLALPVVGVFPTVAATAATRQPVKPLRRGTRLFGEILLALVVFATIAYTIEHPAFLWELFSDPREGLRGLAQALIVR